MVEEIGKISRKKTLISAFFVHGAVEIPFFIFPVIVLAVGTDLFRNMGAFMWIGLGALGTIGALAAGLPAPIFGLLADRYRRGVMIFFSLILSALATIIIGLFGDSFLVMMLGISLSGLGIALYHPAGLSWVSAAFEAPSQEQAYVANYNKILGIHGVGGTIGASIAELSVAFLIDVISWQEIYFYWFFPLVFLATGFWLFVGRHESQVEFNNPKFTTEIGTSVIEETGGKLKASNSTMVIIFAFMFAMSLSWGMTSFILSPFLSEVKKFKISQAAFFVGFSHLIASSGQMLGGVIGDKYSERVALSMAAALQVLILIGIYTVDLHIGIFVLYILLGIVNSIFWPSTNSLLAKSTTHPGSAFGLFMLIVNVVRAFGPGIDGLLISLDPHNYLWIFILSCLFSITAFLCLLVLKKNSQKS